MSVVSTFYHAALDSPVTQAMAEVLIRLLPPARLELTQYDLYLPRLPASLEGLRLLHVSDLHYRPGSELATYLPDLAASIPHDFVLYTGDFIDFDEAIEPVTRLLSAMPPAKGSFAVLGNHDYRPMGRHYGWNDTTRLCEALTQVGVTMLMNSAQAVLDGSLYIVGVDDPIAHNENLPVAMSTVPAEAFSILLAHRPDIQLRLGSVRPDLLLSGHTHGGQIRLPLIGPMITMSRLPREQIMGLYERDGITIFVTRGIGYSGLNLRIGCPAEVALLTLHAAP